MTEHMGDASAHALLASLADALAAGDLDAAVGCFAPDGLWRDILAFTWNLTTLEGRPAVRRMLESCLEHVAPREWRIVELEPDPGLGGATEGWITFETAVGHGRGHLRVAGGLIWTLLTTMEELSGHEEPAGRRRPLGAPHGASPGAKTWKERREEESARLGTEVQPYVVIIGGGQGGIALGARLRQLDVPTIVLERNPRAGDSWRNRYKTLCLHDPVWYDHLPYIPFPPVWPVFSPKDKIGDWLEMYASVMELDYWSGTTATAATYDEDARTWSVAVERSGEQLTLRPAQLVFATGMSGKPNVPSFPGSERFLGEQHHSSEHRGPDDYVGKRVVVVGSNNSAHDIAAALYEAGADVTMVQRSPTTVARSATLMSEWYRELWSEDALERGITTEKADLILASRPYRLLPPLHRAAFDRIRELDAEFYLALQKAGFRCDFGPDDTGIAMKYLRRGSGYYIDVGASQLIIDGAIKLVAGQVVEVTERSVLLDDGTEVPADVIVYATGYGSMNGWVADLVSQEVADRVGKVWGIGSGTAYDPGPWEGEQRNMWKPTQQEALWFHGGNLQQSRFYSRYLALQLKARFEGIPTPVYGLQPSFHRA